MKKVFLLLVVYLLPVVLYAQEKTILFVVEQYMDGSGWHIEPVAEYRFGRFTEAVTHPSDMDEGGSAGNGEFKAFSLDYFPSGKTYPLFHFNQQLGLISIKEADTNYACLQLSASCEPRYSGMRTIEPDTRGLATNDSVRRERKPKMRPTTFADTAEAQKYAKSFYASQRVSGTLQKNIQVSRIRAIDINGDGTVELIADCEATQTIKEKEYSWEKIAILTVILTQSDDGKWKEVYSTFYVSKDESDARRIETFDFIDMDNDGSLEIIMKNYFYEAWNYTIVGKVNGKWKEVFNGAGGGC
jgi:hypothetical protein